MRVKKKKAHLLVLVVFGGEELDLLLKRLAEAVKPLFAGHHIAFVRLGLLAKLRNVAEFLFFLCIFVLHVHSVVIALHYTRSLRAIFLLQARLLLV